MRLRTNQRGFTLVELMIIVAIIGILISIVVGIIVFFVGAKKAVPFVQSQSVTDIAAIEWMENEGHFTDVQLLESYRTNPQNDLGCQPVDDAGFLFDAVDNDGVQQKDLSLCCLGSPGAQPRCDLVVN